MTLRERLNGLALPADEHVEAVMAMADELGHSIRPVDSTVDLRRYTCLVYALGFAGMPEYEAIAGLTYVDVFAGADFANWLLARGHLNEVDAADARPGAFVIYFDDRNAFAHIGVLRSASRVDSKWGNQGLYNHEVFEAPRSYGDVVRYYEPVAYEVGIELFKDFAEEQGVEFQ